MKTNEELNFLDAVLLNIRESYSNDEALSFSKNGELSKCGEAEDRVQRGLVNRVLIRKMLVHRATHKVSVVDAIFCLAPDGDASSWLTVFKEVILPFIRTNKIRL